MNKKFSVYIASPYVDRDRAISLMHLLEAAGVEVTSTWLRQVEADDTDEARRRIADRDMEDIERAHALVAYTVDSCDAGRGTLVEIGYALGRGKPVYWIGNSKDKSNSIFFYASMVKRFSSVEHIIKELQQ